MPFPIQTPAPTAEMVRLLKLVGRYRPELETMVQPVVPLVLNDRYVDTIAFNLTPALSTQAFSTQSRATLLSTSPFNAALTERGWVDADVDVWLLDVAAVTTAAAAANLETASCAVGGPGAGTTLCGLVRYYPVFGANLTKALTSGGVQGLLEQAAGSGFASNLNGNRFPVLLPVNGDIRMMAEANASGAGDMDFILRIGVQLKGLAPPM